MLQRAAVALVPTAQAVGTGMGMGAVETENLDRFN